MAIAGNSGRRTWGGALALIVLLAAAFAWNLDRGYRATVEEEHRDLDNLARIADEHISGSLRSIDFLLRDVADAIGREADIVAFMATRAKAFPEVRTVFFVDEGGRIVEGTLPAIKGMDVRDRAYYQAFRSAPDDTRLRISKPVVARPTGVMVFFASRAMTGAGGGMKGVVAVSLEIKYFNELLKSVLPGGESSVILLNRDGDVLSRAEEAEKYVGRNFAGGLHFGAHLQSGEKASFHRAVAATDGKDRFSVARNVTYSPLVVIVSRTVQDSLARWRQEAGIWALVFGGLAVAVLGLTALLQQHQRRLVEAVDFTEKVIETANVMVVGLDGEGRVRMFNEAAETLTGYRRDEILGRDWFATLVPRDRFPDAWENFRQGLKNRSVPRTFENRILLRSGEERLIAWQNSAIVQDGELKVIVSFGIDVTDRRQAEARLRESEEKFRSLYEFSPVGIALNRMDDGSFIEGNRALFAMTGYSEAEMRELTYWDLTPREYEAEEASQLQFLREKGRYGPYEKEYIRKDGSHVPVLLNGVLILDREGKRVIWSIVQDISRSKEAELHLRRSLEELTHANTELERFAFVAAHDLQEPLRNIVAYSQRVQREMEGTLTADAREHFRIVIDAAHRMRALVGDLVVYSRTMGRFEAFKVFPMQEAADAALLALHDAIEEAGGRVTVTELPEIEGDRVQVTMLLQNLIGNAIKYRRPDEPCRVDVGWEIRSGQWVFHVRDNGIGIERAYWDRIFEAFRRLHAADAYPGTGIGLAICRRIVERHGGRIWVDSEPGKGSSFYFTLGSFQG